MAVHPQGHIDNFKPGTPGQMSDLAAECEGDETVFKSGSCDTEWTGLRANVPTVEVLEPYIVRALASPSRRLLMTLNGSVVRREF